jgi:F-type H+-transporting ATPase subunit delta
VTCVALGEIGLNYATALIDSLESPDDLRRVASDLAVFRALLNELPALTRVLDHPGWAPERRQQILGETLSKLNPHPVTRKFLGVVVENGRVREFAEIEHAYRQLRDSRENVTEAEVTTAVPLDDSAKTEWEETLSRLTRKKLRVRYRTDSSLLGGALTRVGSVVYDGSVRKQLERIRGVLLDESMETKS